MQALLQFVLHMSNRAVKGFDQAEQLSEDELIVFPTFTLQSLDQLVVFRLQAWMSQIRSPLGVGFSGCQRLQDGFARDAKDVTENRAQFDVRFFSHFMEPIDDPSPLLHQGNAHPREIP